MKEIIKSGNLASQKKKTICPECGCEFSFEFTDIDTSTFGCYISCPECGYIIKDFDITRKDFFDGFEDYEEVKGTPIGPGEYNYHCDDYGR